MSLNLIGGEASENFSGKGSTPYEAIRVAYKMVMYLVCREKIKEIFLLKRTEENYQNDMLNVEMFSWLSTVNVKCFIKIPTFRRKSF